MEELLEILMELHPEVDFETEKALMDDNIFDSFDIISVIAEIGEKFDVVISAEDIMPENFNSVETIFALIMRLQNN